MITSDERGGDGGDSTQINGGSKVQVDPLVGQGRADYDSLSGFQNLFPDLASVLLSHQGGNIGSDSTTAETHDEDGNDQSAERSIGVLESGRSGGTSEDHVTSTGGEGVNELIWNNFMNDFNAQVNQ